MRYDTHPQFAEAMQSARIQRIEAVKAELREACSVSGGCEDDCFVCTHKFKEPPVDEKYLAQQEHNNRCLNCSQHVLTTTGIDPLTCWKCRELPESSDPWHQEWHS